MKGGTERTATAAAFSCASSISESVTSDPSETSSAPFSWRRCCVCWLRTASDDSVTPAPASGAAAPGSPFANGAALGGGAALLLAGAGALPAAPPESTALAVAATARCVA